ncbi:ATP-binding protein [Paenibacillus tarimensis]|uniref:ATP-binding protein n=1 Tax=Paenibacillus tarimensis TaxID=416012 RepID=UPI001F1B710E|nr:ATP-binding protein [Paenibacillus tarimensis]MCF2945053.1 ATP-binding protein [Paenibacillus tarimensis]
MKLLRAEDELQLYKTAFQQDWTGKAIIDLNGRWLMVNPSFVSLTGCNLDDLYQSDFFAVFPARFHHLLRPGPSDNHWSEHKDLYTSPSGFVKQLSVRVRRSLGGSGSPYSLVQLVEHTMLPPPNRDQQRIAMQAQILSAVQEGVYAYHQEEDLMVWNEAAELLTGYTAETIRSNGFHACIHAEGPNSPPGPEETCSVCLAMKLGMKSGNMAGHFRRADGTTFPVEYTAVPFNDSCRAGGILTFRDMTEQLQSKDLIILSEKLSIAGQLAAGIAHEIRNPLTSLKGFLSLLRSGTSSNSKRDSYITIMNDELSRIEHISNELLMLAKPRSVQFIRSGICTLIDQVISLLQPQAVLKNVEIIIMPNHGPYLVYCDESQIKQVIINLLKNAMESMAGGGTIRITLEADDYSVYIKIADEGTGIPADKLNKLGQPFYSTKEKGTGLGLMVSYNIIENHNGKIEVESEPGRGTVFTVVLPRADRITAC